MIILLSPAKIQNTQTQDTFTQFTQPEFLTHAAELVSVLRNLSVSDLSELLGIKCEIAQQNFDRYFHWQLPFSTQNAKQAVLTFNGEVFRGLDAANLGLNEMEYAQSHLRILSGLYGILRPLDLIQAYRLEISSKLPTHKGKNLYGFWKEHITQNLNTSLDSSFAKRILLNLASNEYFKVLDLKALDAEVIHVDFLQYRNGETSSVVMHTKKARGLMARFVIKNRIEEVESLKGFSDESYWYDEKLSSESKLVFVR